MERRHTSNAIEIRQADEGGGPVLVGLAAVHYDGTPGTEYPLTSRAVERIAAGAFEDSIASGGDVLARFDHESLLGRSASGTLRLSTDERGLWYEVDLADTSTARDLIEHVRRGDVAGSSFAFRVTSETWADGPDGVRVREVQGVDLVDVGPVVSPAYAATSTGLRSVEIDAETRSRCDARPSSQVSAVRARARAVEVTTRARE